MPVIRPLRLIAAAAGLLATAGPAGAAVIAPGSLGLFEYGQCTLNFVFDGTGPMTGRVFVGSAAHCTTRTAGEEVRVAQDATDGGELVGHVAAFGPYVGAGSGDTRDDWALIEITPTHRRDVDPAMLGHPDYPTRLTVSAEMRESDTLQFSGYGVATQATPTTREQRQGQWTGGDNRLFGAFSPHLTEGDSGGPVVDVKTGGALGLVSGGFGACPSTCTSQGPTITSLIDGAASQGLPVQLRAAGQKAPAAATAPTAQEPPAAQPQPQPQSAPAARLRVTGGCVRRGRVSLRFTANVPLASARLTAPRKQALRLDRPVRLRGLRGRRVRIAVSALTRDGRRVTARATLRAC
jgi:hypothetical protein